MLSLSSNPKEYEFDLATPADEPAIRRLLANNPVPGRVTLSYRREPDYFLGCGAMGHFWQVVVARHRPTRQLAGIMCRATRSLFINGQVEEVGYWSQLRVDEQFRGRWLVSQGFPFLRRLSEDGRTAGAIATIIEGSDQAAGILVKHPRPHFARFREMGRLWTMALILRKSCFRTQSSPEPYRFERGTDRTLGEIVAFLRQQGAAKQFYPAYTEADFQDGPLTRDFRIEDFILARLGGRLVGVLGLWDQSDFKQTVVHSYHGSLGRFRPLYNAGLRLLGARPLPAPGERVQHVFASFIAVADNDPAIFRPLLQRAYDLAARRGYAYLMVGLLAGDPLLAVARRYPHIPYHSRLYTVCWEEQTAWPDRLDDRVKYLELAAL